MTIHIDPEFKKLIPPLIEEDYKRLEESLLKEGCRDALILWGDTLIDGHNRYQICTKHNIPFKTTTKDFADRNEAMLWMIDNQLARRNVSTADRILLAQTKKPLLEKLAKQRQQLSGKMYGRGMNKEIGCVKTDTTYVDDIIDAINTKNEAEKVEAFDKVFGFQIFDELLQNKEPQKNKNTRVRDQIAKIAGVGSGTVAKFEYVQKKAPKLIENIREKEISIDDAYKQAKATERKEKESAREEQRQENAEKIEQLATPLEAQGLFQTIVIDPPWDWGDEGDVNQFGRAKPDYHTMPIEEIEQLPIGKIADDNCHLYLWVTNRSLPKAFKLIESWGFRYITCLTWVKPSIGMGNYFRGATEQVLFAVKGSQPLKRKDVGTWFKADRGKGHSAKPDEFYDLVESCSYAPYIDIFGRKDRECWSVWGENG